MKPESHFHRGHQRVTGGKMHLDIDKGGLHRTLGIPEGETIPKAKVAAAARSDNPRERKQGILAENMEKWHHK